MRNRPAPHNVEQELLDALRAIASGLENTGTRPGEWMTRIMKCEAWNIAVDAIAKAEGRQ